MIKGGFQMKEIKVPDIDYQAEIKKCKTLEDVTGKNGLLQRLFKDHSLTKRPRRAEHSSQKRGLKGWR